MIHAANQSRSRSGRERRLSLPNHGGLDDVDSGGLTRGTAEQGATARATAPPHPSQATVGAGAADALTCVICLQPLADGPCEALLCGHVFHTQCIQQLAAIRQLPKADVCPLKCGMSASRGAAAAAALTGSPSSSGLAAPEAASRDPEAPVADSEAPAAPPSRPSRRAPPPVSPARSSSSSHGEQEDGGAPAAEAGGAEEGDIDQAIELAMAQATADAAAALAE